MVDELLEIVVLVDLEKKDDVWYVKVDGKLWLVLCLLKVMKCYDDDVD